MKVKHYNCQTSQYEEFDLMFWKDGKMWKCKVPLPKNELYKHFKPLEKKIGLIGKGKTKEEAIDDWRKWRDAANFVDAIY